jgi:hypothetical protein
MTLLAFFPFPPWPTRDMVLEAFLIAIGVILWLGLSYCLWQLDSRRKGAAS